MSDCLSSLNDCSYAGDKVDVCRIGTELSNYIYMNVTLQGDIRCSVISVVSVLPKRTFVKEI